MIYFLKFKFCLLFAISTEMKGMKVYVQFDSILNGAQTPLQTEKLLKKALNNS